MKNRFNRLTSKEWLPFQKSWFRYNGLEAMFEENIRFFCKAENEGDSIFYFGNNFELFKEKAKKNNENVVNKLKKSNKPIQFVVFDLLDVIDEKTTLENYEKIKSDVINLIIKLYDDILHRRFITVFIKNIELEGEYYPLAWDIAKHISTVFSLKDEKIGCIDEPMSKSNTKDFFSTDRSTFYALYFRKDENSNGIYKKPTINFFRNNTAQIKNNFYNEPMKSWFILKPQPRKKNEVLHPAKYPEDLVDKFVNQFTLENENVFDPMSGTGSTQVGALRNKRNGYGTELSTFFTEIANKRCEDFLAAHQTTLFSEAKEGKYKILNLDARRIKKEQFPPIDYILTSPPYWDMLNMKGAENQAIRKAKGLQTNYSDSLEDLGNIADYDGFIDELVEIYDTVADLLKPGGILTIVVKNIKKKGKNYPFAWDLTAKLQDKLILLPETFWCQDDISIAPYGYGNTFVSNTFHQYCLNFQKP